MFVNKDDDDDGDHDRGDYYIDDCDKQDNSHDTVPWTGDNFNICCLPVIFSEKYLFGRRFEI